MNGNLLCKNRNSVKDFEAVWTGPQGFLPRPLASTAAAGRREAAGKRSRAPRVRARLAEAPSAPHDSADRAPRGVRGGLVAHSTAARFACRSRPLVRGPGRGGSRDSPHTARRPGGGVPQAPFTEFLLNFAQRCFIVFSAQILSGLFLGILFYFFSDAVVNAIVSKIVFPIIGCDYTEIQLMLAHGSSILRP